MFGRRDVAAGIAGRVWGTRVAQARLAGAPERHVLAV